jgi:methylmalonyl-CoA mutase C-terminal domain/subunit
MFMSLSGKRILVAKPGLDGHDIGAKIITLALRDAGADVIYTGLRKSPEYIARIAVDEDVDALGLSILSGSHNELLAETLRELKNRDAGDIKVFVGGTIPPNDHKALLAAGAVRIFTSEMTIDHMLSELDAALAGTA